MVVNKKQAEPICVDDQTWQSIKVAVYAAYDNGLISEGYATKCLMMDRLDFREFVNSQRRLAGKKEEAWP